jgi:hypothetical protein
MTTKHLMGLEVAFALLNLKTGEDGEAPSVPSPQDASYGDAVPARFLPNDPR